MRKPSKPKKPAPAVALRAREDALSAYDLKIAAMEQLIEKERVGDGPVRTTPTGFIDWEDSSLGVTKTNRSTYYDKDKVYTARREKVDKLLSRLEKLRTARPKSRQESQEIRSLRERLADAEGTAQAYVDQYSTVQTLLEDANKRIRAQDNELVRLYRRLRTVVPLQKA